MAGISDTEKAVILDRLPYLMRVRHVLVPRPFTLHQWTAYCHGETAAAALAVTVKVAPGAFVPGPALVGVQFPIHSDGAHPPAGGRSAARAVGLPIHVGNSTNDFLRDVTTVPGHVAEDLRHACHRAGVQRLIRGGDIDPDYKPTVFAQWAAVHLALLMEGEQMMGAVRQLFAAASTWPQVGRWWPRLYDEIAAIALGNRGWCNGRLWFSGTTLDKKFKTLGDRNSQEFKTARRLDDPQLAEVLRKVRNRSGLWLSQADAAMTIVRREGLGVASSTGESQPLALGGAFSRAAYMDLGPWPMNSRRYHNAPAYAAFGDK